MSYVPQDKYQYYRFHIWQLSDMKKEIIVQIFHSYLISNADTRIQIALIRFYAIIALGSLRRLLTCIESNCKNVPSIRTCVCMSTKHV